jgi:hypothetical protein
LKASFNLVLFDFGFISPGNKHRKPLFCFKSFSSGSQAITRPCEGLDVFAGTKVAVHRRALSGGIDVEQDEQSALQLASALTTMSAE